MKLDYDTPTGQYKAAKFCIKNRWSQSKQVQGKRSRVSLLAFLARIEASKNHPDDDSLQEAWNMGITDNMN